MGRKKKKEQDGLEKVELEEKELNEESLEGYKYVIIIGDGMGDFPVKELDWKTPLEVAITPGMDFIASYGMIGYCQTVPPGMHPGSDVAIMGLLGYPPEEKYTGRGPIEAASRGIILKPEDVAYRCNLVTLKLEGDELIMEDYSAGHISTEEAIELIEAINRNLSNEKIEIVPGVSYRHILIWRGGSGGLHTYPPHDLLGKNVWFAFNSYDEEPFLKDYILKAIEILEKHPINQRRKLENLLPANSIWPWGQGRTPSLEPFEEKWQLKGAVISAVDLIKGLAVLSGMTIINVPGATGYLDTNYEGKVDYAIEALKEHDFIVIHVEAPDEVSHEGSLEKKIKAINEFDRRVVRYFMERIIEITDKYRILVCCDHLTPISIRTHSSKPVPFAIFDSVKDKEKKKEVKFCEKEAYRSPNYIKSGPELLEVLLQRKPHLVYQKEE
ncbi:cofactor-independent phosphoglycerate mutase [Thermodesulfobacterium sp. TA1]|uniref:cofactor-independent phosphoglycerate mutase n=1 Tax=Thermodesulfobacterium sp. TA1 TaxID=2234087 RepID=UPI001232C6E6|nr:cofactor-independent phosphoglycerate mutase [Thermodesulfobacterium sp. TA1]QER41563.1 cofactor-independent phosphoglycerate mutase [Thermodesulfobacterium sp. TA1]